MYFFYIIFVVALDLETPFFRLRLVHFGETLKMNIILWYMIEKMTWIPCNAVEEVPKT